jgi:single-stranded-DNA-specific exonuclease
MGNPVPKLLIKNVRFSQTSFFNIKDKSGNQVSYLQSKFTITDQTKPSGFPGVWWGHHPDELPSNQACDVIVELDFRPSTNKYDARYEVRLIDVKANQTAQASSQQSLPEIIDRRSLPPNQRVPLNTGHPLRTCPVSWSELAQAYHQAIAVQGPLILDYDFTPEPVAKILEKIQDLWHQCHQQKHAFTPILLQKQCGFSDRLARKIVDVINQSGLDVTAADNQYQKTLNSLQDLIAEEQFQKRYFSQISLTPHQLLEEPGLGFVPPAIAAS